MSSDQWVPTVPDPGRVESGERPVGFYAVGLFVCFLAACGLAVLKWNDAEHYRGERDELRATYGYLSVVCDWFEDGSIWCAPGTHAVNGPTLPLTTTTSVARQP